MSSLRSRQTFHLGPVVEWLLAASVLVCLVALGALIIREVRTAPVPPLTAPVARLLPSSIPPAVPTRACRYRCCHSVDGKELKVGDTVESVAATLGRAAEVGRQEVDRGALRRAFYPLLRIQRRPLRAGVRALRAERRRAAGGDLPALESGW